MMAQVSLDGGARQLLRTIGLEPATRAAAGRYLRSEPVAPGVRYWATSQTRLRRDLFGVQFYGDGLAKGAALQKRLETAGFRKRTPQASQLTFAKAAPFAVDDGVDEPALRALRREVDSILQGLRAPETGGFRRFMHASPLADVELEFPNRTAPWRPRSL